ncbi:MAG: tetratricopeptide repeat protein [Candidatus Hydrogenedentes bacterium]|nr:tetratricopeptide repeat protein [Candidatus Hydrogenedentota bacterium]
MCALLVLATFAIFAPTLGFDFVNIDDGLYVTENAQVKQGLSPANLLDAFAPHIGHWHPLTWLSYMLDASVFGARAAGFHFTNLLLHLANVALLFFILNRATGQLWPSAIVAALFAWHPLHVEPVAWISSRKDVLSTFFLFATLGAYIRYVRQPSRKNYLLVALLFGLGLMAKPMLITLPVLLLLLDYWPLMRLTVTGDTSASRRLSGLVWEKLPLFGLAAVSSGLTYWAARSWGAVGETSLTYPLTTCISVALTGYSAYLLKTVWPVGLTAYYVHPGTTLPWWAPMLSFLLLATVTGLVFRLRRAAPSLLVGWSWFVVTLLPVAGFIQIGRHWIADRYAYVPLVGLFILFAWKFLPVLSRPRFRLVALSAAVCLLGALAFLSAIQVSHWRNSETLWRHALSVTSRNHLAHGNLGAYLARQGRFDEAIPELEAAIILNPTYIPPRYNLGIVMLKLGRYAEAARHFTDVVRLRPYDADAYYYLGAAQEMLSQGQDEAMANYMNALRIRPDHALAREGLDRLRGAIALSDQSKPPAR